MSSPAGWAALRYGQGPDHARRAVSEVGVGAGRGVDGDSRRLTRLHVAGVDVELINGEVVDDGPLVDERDNHWRIGRDRESPWIKGDIDDVDDGSARIARRAAYRFNAAFNSRAV